MNKKLLAGFSMLVTVGAFWACGDGTINKMDVADELMATQYNSDNPEKAEQLKKQALEDCEKDPVCKATYADYLANPDAPPPTSSEGSTTNPTSSNSAGTPTSSAGKLVIGGNSSASQTGTSSAGDVGTSSASVAVPGEPTCEPTPKSITQGDTATWTFNPNTTDMTATMAYMEAEFTWELGGSETDGGKGVMTSKAVTYMTTGSQTASVSVKNGMDTKKYTCSALQVNSPDKPTCTCTGTGGDLQKGTTATWTASCTPAASLTYYWNNEAASESNTFDVAYAATDIDKKLAVTLKIGTVDGSIHDGYTCSEVEVTDGPKYKLSEVDSAKTVPLGSCVDIAIDGNLRCAHGYQPTACKIVVTYDGVETVSVEDNFCNNTNGTAVSVKANTKACLSGSGADGADCRITAW